MLSYFDRKSEIGPPSIHLGKNKNLKKEILLSSKIKINLFYYLIQVMCKNIIKLLECL
jgi:hypothetical protein